MIRQLLCKLGFHDMRLVHKNTHISSQDLISITNYYLCAVPDCNTGISKESEIKVPANTELFP